MDDNRVHGLFFSCYYSLGAPTIVNLKPEQMKNVSITQSFLSILLTGGDNPKADGMSVGLQIFYNVLFPPFHSQLCHLFCYFIINVSRCLMVRLVGLIHFPSDLHFIHKLPFLGVEHFFQFLWW